MRIHSLRIENYGPFRQLEEVRLGTLATLIGRNDAGKSHILRALQLFLGDAKLDRDDIHHGADASECVSIEVAFTDLPATLPLGAVEDETPTTLREERLLDAAGCLRIRKRWPCSGAGEKGEVALLTHDFTDERYAGLLALRERDLAERVQTLAAPPPEPPTTRLTARALRATLRAAAGAAAIPLAERVVELGPRDALWKLIEPLLPRFELFETDTRLGVGETTFQSQFRPIVRAAAENPAVVAAREAFTTAIQTALQGEMEAIFAHLRHHTSALTALTARPAFSWEKAVTFDILGRDPHTIERSLDQRGSGMRRLLMVAFFQ
ncbi:MAG: AAA family ATPase [Ktedonobacterales bacterium]|nr:AAA family ATPase [Ktedonobacterales bacterium]